MIDDRTEAQSDPKDPDPKKDEEYMRAALREAHKAARDEEVPVGAVIVHEGRVIGRAHNQTERLKDPTAHAEMIAITQAATALESTRLRGCTLYVTLEPCVMCAGALVAARVDRVVFGAPDERVGACGSVYQVGRDPRLYWRFAVEGGVLASDAAALLGDFFQARRRS